ncbi:MAG: proton-conducting transporter membrane subunit [Gammaproteobacteria bacterium]
MNQYVILTVVLPLLAAFLLPSAGRFSFSIARLIAPLVLLFSTYLLIDVFISNTEPFVLHIGDFIAPQGIAFYIDELALIMALAVQIFALLLWPWKAPGSDTNSSASVKQLSLMLLLVSSANGLAFSGDLFNLYVFYELLAVATYGLIAYNPNNDSGFDTGFDTGFAAAFRYLIVSATGSVLALVGISLIYFLTGTLNFAHLATLQTTLYNPIGLTAFILILVGFGVKAELFPVNSWVPEVYSATSRRLSALLAGVISKLAVLVIIKVMLFIFPYDEARQFVLILGLAGVIVGELSALKANDFTRMISWSSVGQLGLVFVAFSIPGKAGIIAGLAVMFHHMLTKPALFLIAEKWGGNFSLLNGQGRKTWLLSAAFVIIALSIIGVPPLPGFWAKFLLLTGLADNTAYLAMIVILIMTVIEAFYLFRVFNHLYGTETDTSGNILRHSFLDQLTVSVLTVLLLVSVVELETVNIMLNSMTDQLTDLNGYIARVLGSSGAGI